MIYPLVISHSHGIDGPLMDVFLDDLPIKNGDSPVRYVKSPKGKSGMDDPII